MGLSTAFTKNSQPREDQLKQLGIGAIQSSRNDLGGYAAGNAPPASSAAINGRKWLSSVRQRPSPRALTG
jgi:hypothetical protein